MIYALLQNIQALLQKELGNAAGYVNEQKTIEAPNVIIGEVPALSGKNNFPFVTVCAPGGKDTDREQGAEVSLICGVYASEGFQEGTQNIHNLVDRCRLALLSEPSLAQFCLFRPLEWSVGVEADHHQPHPYHLGMIRTTWTTQPIQQELSYE